MKESATAGRSAPAWIDPAGGLALWRVAGAGHAVGGREAIRALAGAPIGRALIAVLAVGLAAYVLWRLSQGDAATGGGRLAQARALPPECGGPRGARRLRRAAAGRRWRRGRP